MRPSRLHDPGQVAIHTYQSNLPATKNTSVNAQNATATVYYIPQTGDLCYTCPPKPPAEGKILAGQIQGPHLEEKLNKNEKFYCSFKHSVGFTRAARKAWEPTVSQAIASAVNPAPRKYQACSSV